MLVWSQEAAGANSCTPLVSSEVSRDAATIGDIADAAAGKGRRDLEENVAVVGVVVAVAVIAVAVVVVVAVVAKTTTWACFEATVQEGYDVHTEAKTKTINPRGQCGSFP